MVLDHDDLSRAMHGDCLDIGRRWELLVTSGREIKRARPFASSCTQDYPHQVSKRLHGHLLAHGDTQRQTLQTNDHECRPGRCGVVGPQLSLRGSGRGDRVVGAAMAIEQLRELGCGPILDAEQGCDDIGAAGGEEGHGQ